MFIVLEEPWESTGISTFQRFSNSACTSLHLVLKSQKSPFLNTMLFFASTNNKKNRNLHGKTACLNPLTVKREPTPEDPGGVSWSMGPLSCTSSHSSLHADGGLKSVFFRLKTKTKCQPRNEAILPGKKKQVKNNGAHSWAKNLVFFVWEISGENSSWKAIVKMDGRLFSNFPFQLGD